MQCKSQPHLEDTRRIWQNAEPHTVKGALHSFEHGDHVLVTVDVNVQRSL